MRILLVEDHDHMLLSLSRLPARRRHAVAAASSWPRPPLRERFRGGTGGATAGVVRVLA